MSVFLFFWWFYFFFALCFCFVKRLREAIFLQSCNFRGVSFCFVPPKGLSLKSVFSSYFLFFFLLSSLSKFHFSLLFVHQPFLEICLVVSFVFLFLPFPFLMFACLFETNFPNIPFLKPIFGRLFFFCCFCFVSWCMFLPFCFYVGFVFGNCLVLFFFFFFFMFLSYLLFAFSL